MKILSHPQSLPEDLKTKINEAIASIPSFSWHTLHTRLHKIFPSELVGFNVLNGRYMIHLKDIEGTIVIGDGKQQQIDVIANQKEVFDIDSLTKDELKKLQARINLKLKK